MLTKNKNSFISYTLVLLLGLVIINVVGRSWYLRYDFTDTKMYSLSNSSKNVVEKIDDLLIMKVYFSEDLPNELGNTRRFLQDLLEEYTAKSNGNIRFYFSAPESNEDLEKEARKDGIQPVQMQVVENDNLEIKQVYLGMVILYDGDKETIPVIQTTTGLEYLITTKIKNLVDTDKKTVGLASFSDDVEIPTKSISDQLKQHYKVKKVDIKTVIEPDIDVLLVSGTKDSVSDVLIKNLDNYLASGKNLLISQSGVHTDMQTQQATDITSNVFDFISKYGVNISKNIVLDKSCGRVQVQQQMGMFRMNVPMEYPFLPIVKSFNKDELIVSGLEQVHLFFPSEIIIDSVLNQNVIDVKKLFSSSNNSGIMSGRYTLSPDPKSNPFLLNLNQKAKLLSSSSVLKNGAELILISDSQFLSDEAGMSIPENNVFLMNAVDYLSGDKELISLRSREITSRPLEEIKDGSRRTWKWINILLPSILIIAFGFSRSKSENNRSKLIKQIYE